MIFYDFKRNLSAAESLVNLTSAFGEKAPSRATVFNWFAEFRRGRASLEDEQRSGLLFSFVQEDSIAAVEKLVRRQIHESHTTRQRFLLACHRHR